MTRDQRRARKARKNLVMYKLAGRRPWAPSDKSYFRRARPVGDRIAYSLLARRFDRTDGDYAVLRIQMRARHADRIGHLREPSGFLEMSRRATLMTGKEGEAAVREAVIEESKRWRK